MRKCTDCNSIAAPRRSVCWHHYVERRNARRNPEQNSAQGLAKRMAERSGPRTLLIDIETAPNVCLVWDSQLHHGGISIDQIKEPGRMLCLAAKWLGEDEVVFLSEWQHGRDGMICSVHELLNEADVVVHYYGSQFDVKWLNSEFARLGLTPPRPYRQVDLKLAVSKQFKLPSNKLDFVARVLQLEGKVKHAGFRLWVGVLEGDPDSLAKMQEYNERDTTLLEECYERLLPWLPAHPHRHLYGGSGCPVCGGEVEPDGYYATPASLYLQYRCLDCGTWSRDSKRLEGTTIQKAVIC